MKKKNLLYMYVINCLPLLFCIVGFIGGALFDFLCVPVLQLVLTGLNFKYSSNWGWLFLLEIHMWIMSVAGIAASTWLWYHLISSDSQTIYVGIVECQTDTVYMAALGLIAVIAKLIYTGYILFLSKKRIDKSDEAIGRMGGCEDEYSCDWDRKQPPAAGERHV